MQSPKMGVATLFCLISFFFYASSTRATKCSIESLYQLGDSLSDTGNSIRIFPAGPFLSANRPPYGETFPGKPTGRWSDGQLIIDKTAKAFGLDHLEPYLNEGASFKNGVNFAVAGCTALDLDTLLLKGISAPPLPNLNVQTSWFNKYLSSICSTYSECANKLRNSLLFLGEIGGNDINYAIDQGKTFEEIRDLVPYITEKIIRAAKDLLNAGVSKIAIPGNFPIGCIPFVLESLASHNLTHDEFGCIESANALADYQNQNLQSAIQILKRDHPDTVIIYLDYYNAMLYLIRKASTLGFDPNTLLKPCCGNGQLSSPQFCGNEGVPVCRNPKDQIHWDGLHLTEAAYTIIFSQLQNSITYALNCTL